MSTQINTYAVIGVLLPYSAVDDHDRFEPYQDSAYEGIKHHDGICIIPDGMSGNYVIAGRVIAKSDEMGHLDAPCVFPTLPFDEARELKGKLEALFPQYPIVLTAIVVSHYR